MTTSNDYPALSLRNAPVSFIKALRALTAGLPDTHLVWLVKDLSPRQRALGTGLLEVNEAAARTNPAQERTFSGPSLPKNEGTTFGIAPGVR